jgi:CRP-like cAMP-binding protein
MRHASVVRSPPRTPLRINSILASAIKSGISGLEPILLTLGEELHAPGEPIRHVYFPTGSLISILVQPHAKGDVPVEVGMIGAEGMLGVSLALGEKTVRTRALVQGSGSAMRGTAKSFLDAMGRQAALRSRALLYAGELAFFAAQTAACNRNHSGAQRLARWLLMVRDRMASDELELTQQFLGFMLALRRAGVGEAAAVLQQRGLIRYARGMIEIQNAEGLKRMSCACLRTFWQ